jgi:hypothetical protein
MKFAAVLGLIIIFLILAGLYAVGILTAYWTLMFSVIFIVVGIVVGFLLLGSGQENMKIGVTLLILGILLFLLISFFPR